MDTTASSAFPSPDAPSGDAAARSHIRGSSLLLAGRLLSLASNFLVQVLLVRCLTKGDYGAFAYALSLVSLGSSIAACGLDKAASRFVPLYEEQRDYPRMFGALLLAVGVILSLGLLLVLLAYTGFLHGLVKDERAWRVLLLLALLVPVYALDSLCGNMLAAFAGSRALFLPRYVIAPGLSLTVVLVMLLMGTTLDVLAASFLVVDLAGTLFSASFLAWVLHRKELLRHFNIRTLKLPARELFSFTLPLLSTELVFMLRSHLAVLLLGHFSGALAVAAFRAVVPVARLNMVVAQSFTPLFTPAAARLFARKEGEEIGRLYWHTAVWIAILTFPLFAVTFALAGPVTVLLFGQQYAQSGPLLALLALGHYVNAALGFNGLTLGVHGKVWYVAAIDLLAALLSLGVLLWLVPHYGALGAAAGTCGTLIIQNLLYQAGLYRGAGIRGVEWRYVRVYGGITAAALSLLAFQWLLQPPLLLSLPVAAAVSLLVLRLNRKLLDLERTFPELRRLPLARRLFHA
jgi:O-antigen/teichoic acid export membrane protein